MPGQKGTKLQSSGKDQLSLQKQGFLIAET